MVSTYGEERSYETDLVRVFSGDMTSEKSHAKTIPVESSFSGQYAGKEQTSYLGSYVEVSDNIKLNAKKV